MIDPIYYNTVFLLTVTALTIPCAMWYGIRKVPTKGYWFAPLALAMLCAWFIGNRPIHPVFADTVGYAEWFYFVAERNFEFTRDTGNVIFDNLMSYMAANGYECSTFFLVIAIGYFVARFISCKKMFPDDSWAAYLVFLGAFLTFASSVNGIKAGIATSFLACAIAYRKKWLLCIVLLLISWGLHHAMHVCIVAFIIATFYKDVRIYSLLWIFSFCMAVLHVTVFQEFFVQLTDEKGAGYLLAEDGWLTGMRYDFVLYSAMPIFLGWYYRFGRSIKDEGYDFVLNLYMLLNAVWMLSMYASFTNRIAALSWGLYPLVLIYPFLRKEIRLQNNDRVFAIVMVLHLSFTLFMHFIYYQYVR